MAKLRKQRLVKKLVFCCCFLSFFNEAGIFFHIKNKAPAFGNAIPVLGMILNLVIW